MVKMIGKKKDREKWSRGNKRQFLEWCCFGVKITKIYIWKWWIAYLKVDEIVLLFENYMKIGMRISLLLKVII
jgi:hypothetical protein